MFRKDLITLKCGTMKFLIKLKSTCMNCPNFVEKSFQIIYCVWISTLAVSSISTKSYQLSMASFE